MPVSKSERKQEQGDPIASNLYQVTALSSPQSHGNKNLFCFKPFLKVSVAGLDQDFIKIRDKDEVLPPRDPPKSKYLLQVFPLLH